MEVEDEQQRQEPPEPTVGQRLTKVSIIFFFLLFFISPPLSLSLSLSLSSSLSVSLQGPYVYELFSIMIHSGSAIGGHYYAYIKSVIPLAAVPPRHVPPFITS